MVDGSLEDHPTESTSLQDLSRLLPMELIDLFEKGRNWNRKESTKTTVLVRDKEAQGKHLYAKVLTSTR